MGIVYDEADFAVRQVDYDVPLNTFSDDELAESLIQLWADVKAIDRQVVEHKLGYATRDAGWVHRATMAKSHKMHTVDLLRMEAQRRGMAEVLPQYAEQIEAQRQFQAQKAAEAARIQAERENRMLPHKLLMEQQREAADRRRAEREEKHRITMAAETERLKGRAELFLAAANKMLSKEQRAAIWAKAVEMFPDHLSFQPRQDGDQEQSKEVEGV